MKHVWLLLTLFASMQAGATSITLADKEKLILSCVGGLNLAVVQFGEDKNTLSAVVLNGLSANEDAPDEETVVQFPNLKSIENTSRLSRILYEGVEERGINKIPYYLFETETFTMAIDSRFLYPNSHQQYSRATVKFNQGYTTTTYCKWFDDSLIQ